MHGRPTIATFSAHAQNLERNVRFESKSRPRPRNSKNRKAKPETTSIIVHSSQLYPCFLKFYSLKQIVTRKRAYPTRDCDNLPGPTYLYLTGIPEVYYLSYLALYLKNGKTGIPTHSFHDSHA